MKFIHFTDTHLVEPSAELHGLNPAVRFKSCIDSIIKQHADADCSVVTGDIADGADESAYVLFAEQLRRLTFPCHLIIGNHDNRELFVHHFPHVPVDDSGFVQYAVETPEGIFLMLDTIDQGSPGGVYCETRQAWLCDMLTSYADQPVYLFMHHPPFDIHLPCIDRIGLAEKQAFSDIVGQHKIVRHLFFGHAHRPISGSWQGISFSSLRGTNHQVNLDFNDEKISFVDEPPEYSVVFLTDETVVVHSHSYPLVST